MQCTICGLEINSEEVYKDDWIYSFFDGEEEHGPLCPSCSDILLYIAKDGEYTLKEEYRGKIAYNDQMEQIEDDPLTDVLLGFILN